MSSCHQPHRVAAKSGSDPGLIPGLGNGPDRVIEIRFLLAPFALDHLGAAAARGALVDAVAGFLVLGQAELLHFAVAHGVLAAEGRLADQALDRLAAAGATPELGLGEALHDLEAALAP